MKLNEIINWPKQSYASKWLNAHRVTDFGESHDGSIIIASHLGLFLGGIEEKRLPFKIAECKGGIDLSESKLETLEGLPKTCGTLIIRECKGITNFKDFPESIKGTLDMRHTGITSFVGIADHIKEMRDLYCSYELIKDGGLGLILIKNLTSFTSLPAHNVTQFEIIEKYLGHPDKIFECQAELISAGFEEYAKL